jgi:hypothetical protein
MGELAPLPSEPETPLFRPCKRSQRVENDRDIDALLKKGPGHGGIKPKAAKTMAMPDRPRPTTMLCRAMWWVRCAIATASVKPLQRKQMLCEASQACLWRGSSGDEADPANGVQPPDEAVGAPLAGSAAGGLAFSRYILYLTVK